VATAITDPSLQNLLTVEVGLVLDDITIGQKKPLTRIMDLAPFVWAMYQRYTYWPQLQYLYAKRKLIDMAIGQLRMKVNQAVGPEISKSLGQYIEHLADMRKDADADIELETKKASASRPLAVGELDTATLLPPPDPLALDPSDSYYYGDLNKPSPEGGWPWPPYP
jgi:hypothetical protein